MTNAPGTYCTGPVRKLHRIALALGGHWCSHSKIVQRMLSFTVRQSLHMPDWHPLSMQSHRSSGLLAAAGPGVQDH